MKRKQEDVASYLRDEGERSNQEFARAFDAMLQRLRPFDYFEAAIADGFIWTGHAKETDGFLRLALRYLGTGDEEHLVECPRFSRQYGPDALSQALRSWWALKRELGYRDLQNCDASTLQIAYSAAEATQRSRKYPGIGAWLLGGPFKVIAVHRTDLWEDSQIDEVIMPTGSPVIRGAKMLLNAGYNFGSELSVHELSETEGGLEAGLSTSYIVHNYCRKMAAVSGGRAVHLNTGLYLLGEGTIDLQLR